jgi:uncharacterized protein
MNTHEQIELIQGYCQKLFANDSTGHDYFHLRRVANIASKIAEEESADNFICTVGAWLHDVGDKKLFSDPDKALNQMDNFLISIKVTKEQLKKIHLAIEDVSFSKGNVPTTIEGKIIQDADRIDAIGAIGIARTFAYGGAKGQLLYHDEDKDGTSVQHFYDKILRLKDTLHTDAAKIIAAKRHAFIEAYLEQFLEEWD